MSTTHFCLESSVSFSKHQRVTPLTACCSLSWFESSCTEQYDTSAELSLKGRYSVYRKDRSGCTGGGVCILINQHVRCVEVPTPPTDSELVAVDIETDSLPYCRLICAYYSPTGMVADLQRRMQTLCDDLDLLLQTDYPIVLTGDFNVPTVNWCSPMSTGSEESKEHIFASFCIDCLNLPARPPDPGVVISLIFSSLMTTIW